MAKYKLLLPTEALNNILKESECLHFEEGVNSENKMEHFKDEC